MRRIALFTLFPALLFLLSACAGNTPSPIPTTRMPHTQCTRMWKFDDHEGCLKRQAGEWEDGVCWFDDCSVVRPKR